MALWVALWHSPYNGVVVENNAESTPLTRPAVRHRLRNYKDSRLGREEPVFIVSSVAWDTQRGIFIFCFITDTNHGEDSRLGREEKTGKKVSAFYSGIPYLLISLTAFIKADA